MKPFLLLPTYYIANVALRVLTSIILDLGVIYLTSRDSSGLDAG